MIKKAEPYFWFLARVFIGLVLAYAGFFKLMEPIGNLRGSITQYGVIPYVLVPWIAAVLPWMEFITGVFLILGYAPKYSAIAAAGLCFGFLMVLGSSDQVLNGSVKDCGCFGDASPIHLSPQQVFILDFLNFLMAIRLAQLKEHFFSLDTFLRAKAPSQR